MLGIEMIDFPCPKVCPAIQTYSWTCRVHSAKDIRWSVRDKQGKKLGSSLTLAVGNPGPRKVGSSTFSAVLTSVNELNGRYNSDIVSDGTTDVVGYELECSTGNTPPRTCRVMAFGKFPMLYICKLISI